MKKLLIITILSLFTFNLSYSNNQSDTIPSKPPESVLKQLPDSLNLTFKEVYSDVKEGLQGLGSALKVGSEHVYNILIKKQIAMSYLWLFVGLISTILLIICINKGNKNDWDDKYFFTYILCGGLGSILFITFLCNIDEIFLGLISPEYGAIKEIINFIK